MLFFFLFFATCRPASNKPQPTPLALERTASGVVQEFLRSQSDSSTNSAPFTSTPLTSPSPDSPPSPPTPGKAPSEDEVFLLNDSDRHVNTNYPKSHKGMLHKQIGKAHTTSCISPELYEIQNGGIVSGGSGSSSSSHDDDTGPAAEFDLSASLPPNSSVWGNISPDLVGTSKSIRTRKKAGGFFTIQRPWKTRKQNSMAIKSQLLEIDIVPPSPTSRSPTPTDETDPGMRWMRRSAFKKKRKRSTSVFGPAIPETSYSFEVANPKACTSVLPLIFLSLSSSRRSRASM